VVFSQRPDLSFSYVSPVIESLTGIPTGDWMRRSHVWETIHEGDREELERQLRCCAATGQSSTTLRVRNRSTGRIAYVLEQRQAILGVGGIVLGYEGFWVDITRQTIAEKSMTSGAWKETLAVLTMGLAHDFGNILAGIHSLSETMEDVLATVAPEHRGSMNLIRRNAMMASQIVRRIVALHQGKLGEFGYHSLNSLMTDLEELVRKIVPRRIQVESEYSKQELPAYLDAVEFRQVVVNLVLNAAEAIPQVGKIRLLTNRHSELPSVVNCQGTIPSPPLLEVIVADTGTGIPARYLRSIFEPFFTTKSLIKGTGLGLYNAWLFVERHKGAISVESTEGQGTAFHLWLPEATFQEAERHLSHDQAVRRALLLLDLPGRPRDATAEFLRRNGYLVVVEEPERAFAQLYSGDYRIAAIVLQATRQQVPSVELVRQLRRRAPEARLVLLITGRNQDELPVSLLQAADLVLSQGLSESEILGKISTLFN
jgi:signal transduction histidine kinase